MFFCQIGSFFVDGIGKKTCFLALEMGRISASKSGDREP